jgi:hypothetical protein
VAWLEARAANGNGKIDEQAMEAIRRGWYLGKESFKDKLLRMLEKPKQRSGARPRAAGVARDHGETEALRLVREGSRHLGLPPDLSSLRGLSKTDPRKVALAILLRTHTSVSNAWIAEHLEMGHPGSVSRSVSAGRATRKTLKNADELGKLLKCVH